MDPNQAVSDAQNKLKQAVEHFQEELKKLRTGRAHPSMLDGIKIEAYGVEMPLIQVATVSTPEAQLLQITPFDPSNLEAISTAIRNDQGLGMNPSDDGHVVRVPVPPLTEERRREIVKQVGQRHEEAMISMRNIRHDAMDAIDKAKKDKSIGEDDAKRLEKQVDDAMNKAKADAEAAAKAREQEIMSL
ncbi:ribosome recycling factor [Candidatus Saccharibacteria bacterium]|nr:ribosome recycling factor [Candidatus Saccharibacteria bacterium]